MTTDLVKIDRKKLIMELMKNGHNYKKIAGITKVNSKNGIPTCMITTWNANGWPRDKFERLCTVLGVTPGALIGD